MTKTFWELKTIGNALHLNMKLHEFVHLKKNEEE